MDLHRKQPCDNCPYRLDAPLQMWHKEEFKKLMEQDEQWGAVYHCHKKDGHVCVGWLMKQDEQRCPNLNLRLLLIKKNINRTYLDALRSPAGLYSTVEEMIQANFPELFFEND